MVDKKTNHELSQEVKLLREEVFFLTQKVTSFQSLLAKHLEDKQNAKS
jgi:hypothetical protein